MKTSVSLLFIWTMCLLVQSCNSPEIRKERVRREPPSAIVQQSSTIETIYLQHDLGVRDSVQVAQVETQPVSDQSEIVVIFNVNPPKAKLLVDTHEVTIRGSKPRTDLLTRGPHIVKVESDGLPTVIEQITVSPDRKQFSYDLDVALWLLGRLKAEHVLYQQDAAIATQAEFGEEFTHENRHGNLAINQTVLQVFRKLSANSVVWIRNEKFWRLRDDCDGSSRVQDE